MNDNIPNHVAIIMDGNGRWAANLHLPRAAGHKAGVDTVRKIIKVAAEKGVSILTLFAFGQENWRRPDEEVSFLMNLLLITLRRELKRLHKNKVKLQVIGAREQLASELVQEIVAAEKLTEHNTGLHLVIAINYSGRWDILQATKRLCQLAVADPTSIDALTIDTFSEKLTTSNIPEPDLFIRTSGEYRISNFLLWQLAYTELYFIDKMWPEFTEEDFINALSGYQQRERRYGKTSKQIKDATC